MLRNQYAVIFSPLKDTDHVSSPLHRVNDHYYRVNDHYYRVNDHYYRVNDHYYGRTDEVYCTNNKELRTPFTIKCTNVRNRSPYSLGFV